MLPIFIITPRSIQQLAKWELILVQVYLYEMESWKHRNNACPSTPIAPLVAFNVSESYLNSVAINSVAWVS